MIGGCVLLPAHVAVVGPASDFGVYGFGGFGVWGSGFGVWGLGFGVWGLGFAVYDLGFWVLVFGVMVSL